MAVGFVAPGIRVAAVVAQAVEEFGEIKVEIAQESIHAHHIGERDAQVAAVFVHPGFECGFLEIAQAHIQRLKSLQKFVRHGADGGDAELFGQVNIAGAAENIGHGFVQGFHHMLLPGQRVAAAGAEIGNQKRRLARVLAAVERFEQRHFGLKAAAAFFEHFGGFEAAEIKLVYNCQRENLKKHRLNNRAFYFDIEAAVLIGVHFDKAALELE